ncbi:MAG: MATE family efflux transporter [Ruminococcaceae bacterium]|nr:MATE family efflux transporter [Oscillospiraceae bacterium]
MSKAQNFTEGKIFSPLMRFSLPVLLALFLQAMYSGIDLLIVGQFGGDNADIFVSAVSTGSQIMMTVTFVVSSLAMGLTVYVAEKIGAGKREEAGQIIGSGISLFSIISIILTVVMVLASSALAQIMHAPKEAFDNTVFYIAICSAGMLFIVAYNLVGSIFRGIGDSKIPLLTVAIACVLNILGDLLLVAVFDLGAVGAALATIFAQAMSVVISLFIVRKRKMPFDFSRKYIRPNSIHIKAILRLGTPIALQDLLVSISFLVILAIVNELGLNESAGIGVAEKVCAFIMLIPSSFMQSMSAFVAQNIGALKYDRAKKALWYGIASSLAVGIVVGYFSFFHGDILARIFAKDAAIIVPAADYLKAYAIDCVLTSFLFCFMGYFNGCGNTTFVMIQGIIGGICVRLPVSWAMSKLMPVSLFRIGLATPISSAIQIILCVSFFIIMQRMQNKKVIQQTLQ